MYSDVCVVFSFGKNYFFLSSLSFIFVIHGSYHVYGRCIHPRIIITFSQSVDVLVLGQLHWHVAFIDCIHTLHERSFVCLGMRELPATWSCNFLLTSKGSTNISWPYIAPVTCKSAFRQHYNSERYKNKFTGADNKGKISKKYSIVI